MASNDTESFTMHESIAGEPAPADPRKYKSFKSDSPHLGMIANNILTGSIRKKFAKLKIKFELAMKDGNELTKEELRIQALSKRLKEQNEYVAMFTFLHLRYTFLELMAFYLLVSF